MLSLMCLKIFVTAKKRVCLDKCMAKPIMSLWAAGLKTLNCCCGHNKDIPSIIIPEDADPKAYAKILTRYPSTFLIGKWCHDELQWWIAYGSIGTTFGFPALSERYVKVS